MSLPPPPLRSDGEAVFADKGDVFMAYLPTFEADMNALNANVNARQTAAAASETQALAARDAAAASQVAALGSQNAAAASATAAAGSATASDGSATAAAGSATTATTQAGIATTQATNASNSATAAAASAASIAAGPVASVNGMTGVVTGLQPAGTYATGTGTASGTNTGDETLATLKAKLGITTLSGSNTGDQVIPTTLPASDVYAWAKAAVKPSYTAAEVGLGNVNNTADSAKSVNYASTAGSAPANGGTSAACSGNAATASLATKNACYDGATPSYKYGFTTSAVQNPGGNWGKAVMIYDGNGQTYGVRVDRADYADSAGSIPWGSVTAKPTMVSSFTNDSGYITAGGRAYPRRSDGGDLNFYWSGQVGQPSWLWGGSDGANMYVYNPSNFSVAYATNAGTSAACSGNAATATSISGYHNPTMSAMANTTVYRGGSGEIYAAAFYYSSDRALKHNIRDLEATGIDKLRPRSFSWNSTDKGDKGFIAQEILQDLPEAHVMGEDGSQGLNLTPIVAELVAEVQALKRMVLELRGG